MAVEGPIGVKVSVNERDLARVQGIMRSLGANMRAPMLFLPAAGTALMNEVQRAFREEADPTTSAPWQDLAQSTKAGRSGYKKGMTADRASRIRYTESKGQYKSGKHKGQQKFRGVKILQDKGTLKRSIVMKLSRYSVEVGTNIKYARIHQFGGKAGRHHRTKIEARPFLPRGWTGRLEKAVIRALVADMRRGPVARYVQYVRWNKQLENMD